MKHVVLRDLSLQGWEYGMLRALEYSIIKATSAEVIDLPQYATHGELRRFEHGMRLGRVRGILPRKTFRVEADVIWCILMGPENLKLDLFKGWEQAKYRIVYLFDTLPKQYTLIQRLFSSDKFNIKITSFNDAKDDLEKLTGKEWHVIEQAGAPDIFYQTPFEEKTIHFSSYGRRSPVLHEALLDFCNEKKLYYDYTTHDGKHPTSDPTELYKQYAWHLNHSLFTVALPVEFTNPARAGHLHPITCRWFEAACSGAIVIGKKPDNEIFDKWLFPNLVTNITLPAIKNELMKQLAEVWANRKDLYTSVNEMRKENYTRLTWDERAQRMLNLIF